MVQIVTPSHLLNVSSVVLRSFNLPVEFIVLNISECALLTK